MCEPLVEGGDGTLADDDDEIAWVVVVGVVVVGVVVVGGWW